MALYAPNTKYLTYNNAKQLLLHFFPEKELRNTINRILESPTHVRDIFVRNVVKTVQSMNEEFSDTSITYRHKFLNEIWNGVKENAPHRLDEKNQDESTTLNTRLFDRPYVGTEEEIDRYNDALERAGDIDREVGMMLNKKMNGGFTKMNHINRRKAGGFNLLPVKGYPRNPRGLDYELMAEAKASGGFIGENDLMSYLNGLSKDYAIKPGSSTWKSFLDGINQKRSAYGGLTYKALDNLVNKYLKVDADAVKRGGMINKKADGGAVRLNLNLPNDLDMVIQSIAQQYRNHPRVLDFLQQVNERRQQANFNYQTLMRMISNFFGNRAN